MESIALVKAPVQKSLMVIPRREQKDFSRVWNLSVAWKLTCWLSGSFSGILAILVSKNLDSFIESVPSI